VYNFINLQQNVTDTKVNCKGYLPVLYVYCETVEFAVQICMDLKLSYEAGAVNSLEKNRILFFFLNGLVYIYDFKKRT
jgi:hypothetical protein